VSECPARVEPQSPAERRLGDATPGDERLTRDEAPAGIDPDFADALSSCDRKRERARGDHALDERPVDPHGSSHLLCGDDRNGSLAVTGAFGATFTHFVELDSLTSGGNISLCLNESLHTVSTCASSLRYKSSVQSFSGGLDIVRRLHPITFDWKEGGMHDVGFAAEQVAKVEPLLTTRNGKGEVEGVKYGQITAVLVNAVQQQQAQIAEQQRTIHKQQQQNQAQQNQLRQQQQQLDALKRLVCLSHPRAKACK